MSRQRVVAVLMLMAMGCGGPGAPGGCSPMVEPIVEQRAEPLMAVASPPRVLWLLDNSGSVAVPINEGAANCPVGCIVGAGGCNGCVARKQLLLDNMAELAVADPNVRQGSVVFPIDLVCGAPDQLAVPLPPVGLPNGVALIKSDYKGRNPGGGTPTAAALDFVTANVPPEPGVDTYVVLVTDGVPNCNPQNLNTCVDPAACRCTVTNCGTDQSAPFCSLGCLDDLGTIDASRRLAETGALLMIVGVGAELATGAQMLSSLTVALPRRCASNADCRVGTTCLSGGECSERIYLVNEAADFVRPRDHLADAVRRSGRCHWLLERDVARQDLVVTIDGAAVDDAAWALEGGRRVRFEAAACNALLSSSAEPVFTWRPAPEP